MNPIRVKFSDLCQKVDELKEDNPEFIELFFFEAGDDDGEPYPPALGFFFLDEYGINVDCDSIDIYPDED